MKRMFVIMVILPLLAACSTVQPKRADPNYAAYLQAVSNYHPKLVELVAQDNQTIELKGVKEFIVYAPTNARGQIAVYRPQLNPGVEIVHDFLHTVLGGAIEILPGYFGWRYGSGILKKAFDAAGNHYNGDYTSVNGDYTLGDKTLGNKYTAQGDIVGGDKVGGDKAGQSIYKPGGDYVGTDKTTVNGDYIPGTETNNSNNTTKTSTTGNIDNGSVSQ